MTRVERLLQLLFPEKADQIRPPRRIFAVLDGARDPEIHRLVQESGRPFACMYRGELAPPLVEVAPWLVELEKDGFTRRLLEEGWGESWGIFVETRAELPRLLRHLRSFLKARDTSGRTLLFRYYDPRVFRVYLPTVGEPEFPAIVGPVLSYLMESEDAERLLQMRPQQGSFACEEHPLLQSPEPRASAG